MAPLPSNEGKYRSGATDGSSLKKSAFTCVRQQYNHQVYKDRIGRLVVFSSSKKMHTGAECNFLAQSGPMPNGSHLLLPVLNKAIPEPEGRA
jgi:hypothetical protein